MKIDPSNFTFDNASEPQKLIKSTRFDDETLAALRARLTDYLAACGVELHRKGTRLAGLCPVHEDRTPSFHIFGTDHEICGCYPCGFTGDVFAVSKWMSRSSTFPEAVRDVAGALGRYLPQSVGCNGSWLAKARPRSAKQPAPPMILSDSDRAKIHAARLAFSNALHGDDPIIDRIAASLGFEREILRLASWGSSGIGLANGWLCYAYPQGLKWRNPDSKAKPRFMWIVGKALAPWRMESVKPETRNVYVTEGESDCLALMAAGLEADGTAACIALPGTSFPQAWAPLFRSKRVVLCFDADPAGRAATSKVAAILKGHAAEILTWKGPASYD